MEIKNLTEDAALHLLKAGTFGDQRFVLMEMPEGIPVVFHTNRDASGSVLGLDTELFGTLVDTMTARTLEMVNDLNQVMTEQDAVCDRMEAQGEHGVRPDFPSADSVTIYGIVYGGMYPADGIEHHVGEDTPVVPARTHYTQMVTFSAYAMEINGVPVDFYSMGATCMSYGIPVCPTLVFSDFAQVLSTHASLKDYQSIIPAMTPLLNGECEPILKDDQLQGLPRLEDNPCYGHLLRSVEPTDTVYKM